MSSAPRPTKPSSTRIAKPGSRVRCSGCRRSRATKFSRSSTSSPSSSSEGGGGTPGRRGGGCGAAGLCREAASPPPDRQCRRHTHRPGAPASRRHPHLMSVDGPSWAIDMLRTARGGRLATANRTGQPLVVPVCFALVDESIYSAVYLKPKRTRELAALVAKYQQYAAMELATTAGDVLAITPVRVVAWRADA